MQRYICENILSLSCPVGEFAVCHGAERIPFSIHKNGFNIPYSVYDDMGKSIIYEITSESNYAMDIETKYLAIGKQYDVIFSEGGLHFCGSDEHTESITNTINNWSVGIGSYDMNEDEDNPKNYKGYDVWRSEDNLGFSFVLLDRTIDKITFLVAWIENKKVPNIDYESVLDFWLT